MKKISFDRRMFRNDIQFCLVAEPTLRAAINRVRRLNPKKSTKRADSQREAERRAEINAENSL